MPPSRSIRAGAAHVEIGVHDKLTQGLRNAEAKVRAFGQNIVGVGTSMAAAGAAIVAPLAAATKVFANMGDQLDKMSKRTGVSVEALSEMKFVASQTGTDFGALENAYRRMQKTIYDAGRGLSTAVDGLRDLGLSYADLAGKAPDRQFAMIADAISRIPDPTRQAGIAMTLLGRTGTALLPMFADGAAGIEALRAEARELGLTISTESATAAAEFTDKMDALWQSVKIAVFEIGNSLAPAIQEAAAWIVEIVKDTVAWIKENHDLIVAVAKVGAVLLGVGTALVAVGKIIGAVAAALKIGAVMVKVFTAALWLMTAHPIVAALAAIAAGIAGITYLIYKAVSAEETQAQKRRKAHNERIRQLNAERRKEAEAAAERRKARIRDMNEAVGAKAKTASGKAGAFLGKGASSTDNQIKAIQAEAAEAVAAMGAVWKAEAMAAFNEQRDPDYRIRHDWQRAAGIVQDAAARRIDAIRTDAGNREAMRRQEVANDDIARRVKAIQAQAKAAVDAGSAGAVQRLIANNAEAAAMYERHQRVKARAARLGDKASAADRAAAAQSFMEFAMVGREGRAFTNPLADIGRSVQGTFSSERLGGMGASSPVVDQLKKGNKLTKQVVNNTKPKPMGP